MTNLPYSGGKAVLNSGAQHAGLACGPVPDLRQVADETRGLARNMLSHVCNLGAGASPVGHAGGWLVRLSQTEPPETTEADPAAAVITAGATVTTAIRTPVRKNP